MGKTFSQLREKWAFELSGKDPSAVESQLLSMTWDFASYEVLIKGLQLAPRDDDGTIRRSGLLFQLLERSFAQRVLMFIRRIVDLRTDSISLVRTLEEMERHRNTMTRHAMIEADGLVYDYEPIRRKFYEWMAAQGDGAFTVPQELHWELHAERHRFIDRLTGINERMRSPSDVIPKHFFANLANRVKVAGESAKTYVDSHLAHAGKPQSRALKGADDVSLNFSDLRGCLKSFCEVVSLVKKTVLWQTSLQWLAMPTGDQFAHIDQPLVVDSQVSELRLAWSDFETETQEWADWGLDEYQGIVNGC